MVCSGSSIIFEGMGKEKRNVSCGNVANIREKDVNVEGTNTPERV